MAAQERSYPTALKEIHRASQKKRILILPTCGKVLQRIADTKPSYWKLFLFLVFPWENKPNGLTLFNQLRICLSGVVVCRFCALSRNVAKSGGEKKGLFIGIQARLTRKKDRSEFEPNFFLIFENQLLR